LISFSPLFIVRAMSKYLVVIISLLWACLLLISWSGPAETRTAPDSVVVTGQGY